MNPWSSCTICSTRVCDKPFTFESSLKMMSSPGTTGTLIGRALTLPCATTLEVFEEKSPWALAIAQSRAANDNPARSEEHTSELQSQFHLVCRLLLEKKNKTTA